jgi:hypothetical protein
MTSAIPHPKVFISHSSKDKAFVRYLVGELRKLDDISVWFDETELLLGDSIVGKISDAIRDTNYLIVVLSRSAVSSPWVQRELNAALMKELSQKGMLVIPIRIDDCEVPPILQDRVYADLRAGLDDVLQKLRRVFSMEAAQPKVSDTVGVIVRPTRPGPLDCPGRCETALGQLKGHDLRRQIQHCVQLKQLRITWHAVFDERMEDVIPNADITTAAFEMVLKATDLGMIGDLIRELCRDFAKYFNAKQ